MPHIQLTGRFQQCSLSPDVVVYYYNKRPAVEMSLFEDALQLSLWRAELKPFACVVVHVPSHEVILVRDHLGIEPLYYCHHQEKTLIIGQTIPDILEQLDSRPPWLENQINMLFSEHKYYSDETLYQSIYRVEPGHIMHFKTNGSVIKTAFWQLDPHGPLLKYKDEREYLEHFSMLMNESILNATENQTNVAAEFSAGLDSSAVYCATVNINVTPKLYMHIAQSGTKSANIYNDFHEKAFVDYYQLADIQRIGAEDFDPLQVFDQYASWFAGPLAYLFPIFASQLHRSVAAGKHSILLSGFGGDQCVSGQLPLNFFLPELIYQGMHRQAWRELNGRPVIKKALLYAKHMHPSLYAQALNMKVMKRYLHNALRPNMAPQSTRLHPYERMHYPSVREAESALLQGTESHEVRMRIEDSSIASKQMGFEYRYPLLYPKLLEFMLSVPTVQKRRDGRGRYLIRQYLSQFLPADLFNTYRKQSGLGIVPSTFDLYQQQYEQGCYQHAFKDLPYSHLIQNNHQAIEMRNYIKGFMFGSASLKIPIE